MGEGTNFRTDSFQSLWTATLFWHVTNARHEFRMSHICRIGILNGGDLILILFWFYCVGFKFTPAGIFEFIQKILGLDLGSGFSMFVNFWHV